MARPLGGYPTSIGNKKLSVFPVTGPASYTQYTAPTTGGQDVVLPPLAGIKGADVVFGGVTTDGLYEAKPVQIEASTYNGTLQPGTQVVLKWYVVATGAEVAGAVDLSGSTVYLTAIGNT